MRMLLVALLFFTSDAWVAFAENVHPDPSASSPVDSLLTEDMIHMLRDPFQMPTILSEKAGKPKTDLETFQLKDFKLNGVITGPRKTRAMVTGPNGISYFLAIGDHIGTRDGHVIGITPDAVRVVEYDTDEHGKKIAEQFEMTMSGEVVSLTKKEE